MGADNYMQPSSAQTTGTTFLLTDSEMAERQTTGDETYNPGSNLKLV